MGADVGGAAIITLLTSNVSGLQEARQQSVDFGLESRVGEERGLQISSISITSQAVQNVEHALYLGATGRILAMRAGPRL